MKTILMLPSWYPTKENPFAGSFFREQAIALNGHFDFKVLHIEYKKTFFIQYIFSRLRKPRFTETNKEYNISEYKAVIHKVVLVYILGRLFSLKKRPRIDGVGRFIPKIIQKFEEKQVKRLLRKNPLFLFDYVYGLTAQDMAGISEIFSRLRKKPLILGEHAPFPWPGGTISDMAKSAIEKSDLFLAISNDKIRQVLLQNIKPKRIEYLCNLVDESMFKPKIKNEGEKTFITVAANSFYKNYDMFINVFNRLKELTDIPFKVMVVGYNANKGYSKDSEKLEKKLKSSLFSDNLCLVPSVPRHELSSLYEKADCFVMTSIQEGQPVSALEAGCSGLAIFSTRCGGVEDYVDDKIGRIFNITDFENFSLGLKAYLEGKIVFDSEYIRNTIIDRFGKNAFVNNFVRLVESL